MTYRNSPLSEPERLDSTATFPLTPRTFLPLAVSVSVACRGLALWAVIAVNTVTLAALIMSAWSIALWNRRRNADRDWRRSGETMSEFRFALDAADDRFARAMGAVIVLAILMYTPVVVTHPTERFPTPPTAR
ncbi:MAG: hypothetical protein U0269_14870 [Polyangiales bacterium]